MERHVAVPGGSKNSTAVSNSRNAVVVGRFVATGCSGVTNAQMASKLPARSQIAVGIVTLDNARDNRGAATRTEAGLL